MDDGNAGSGRRLRQKLKMHKLVDRVKDNHEQRRADDVEVKVNQCGTACVFGCTCRGNQRSDTGTDVLTHDDGQCRTKADRIGDAQRLQDTDRSGRRLDNRSQNRTDQQAENRMREHRQNTGEFRDISQRFDCRAHRLHTGHQHREPEENLSKVTTAFVLAEHQVDNTDCRQYRRKGRGFAQLNKEVVARNRGQRQQPGGNGRADVRTHNDAYRLGKAHDARVYKTDNHDRCGRRRLNDRRDTGTKQNRFNRIAGQFFQNPLKFAAGSLGQTVPHDIHTIKEQRKTAYQCQKIEDTHTQSSLYTLFPDSLHLLDSE